VSGAIFSRREMWNWERRGDAMLYMLLIYGREEEWKHRDRTQRARIMDSHMKALQMENDDGVLVASGRLLPTAHATTVRATEAEILVLDGPFAETKEQFGGFQLLNCDSLEHVLKYVRRFVEHGGTVEIRPLHPDPVSLD
jgi:hypothetical protein